MFVPALELLEIRAVPAMVVVTPSATIQNPAYGTSDTLTAIVHPVVAGPTPTGTVTFYYGATPIGGTTVNDAGGGDGVATFNFASTFGVPCDALDPASYTIYAYYSGDDNYDPYTSSSYSLTVSQITPTVPSSVTVASYPSPAYYGAVQTLSIQITNSTGEEYPTTGNVDFYDNSTSTDLGEVALDGTGTATLYVDDLAPGAHSISATYEGNVDYYGPQYTSINASVTIAKAPFTMTLSYDGGSYLVGQSITDAGGVSVAVSGGVNAGSPDILPPGGSVVFYDSAGAVVDTEALPTPSPGNTGSVSFTPNNVTLPPGDTITAYYSGDGNYLPTNGYMGGSGYNYPVSFYLTVNAPTFSDGYVTATANSTTYFSGLLTSFNDDPYLTAVAGVQVMTNGGTGGVGSPQNTTYGTITVDAYGNYQYSTTMTGTFQDSFTYTLSVNGYVTDFATVYINVS
jgi:large repetitive protein